MFERQVEPIKENATAEQGPAHNLCASDLHSVRPSSSSINPWRNTAGRDPEQDANSVHSTKHVQKTQLWEKDIIMLEGTEKPVALKHEESEVSALIHKPHDDANERLKIQVLQNIGRHVDVDNHV